MLSPRRSHPSQPIGLRLWTLILPALLVFAGACSNGESSDDSTTTTSEPTTTTDPSTADGTFSALTYNVAGLPEGLSGSHPERNTPLIAPLLGRFDVVLLQETWTTPDPNPTPFRTYHEILEAAATQAFRSTSATAPLGSDPARPSALLADGLNRFSTFDFPAAVTRVRWNNCGEDAADCLSLKGFSVATTTLADGIVVDIYNLHMEAGGDDSALRAENVDQLADYIEANSAGRAVVVGGDFNLHTEEEPDGSQFADLLDRTGLADACTELDCPEPERIDKFLYRSSDDVELTPTAWSIPTGFDDPEGAPLSDHLPVLVEFDWSSE